MGVGASTWASGSQVCTGTAGSLMTKPMNSSRNAQNWIDLPHSSGWLKGEFSSWPMAVRARMLKVWTGVGRGLSQFRHQAVAWSPTTMGLSASAAVDSARDRRPLSGVSRFRSLAK